MGRLAAIQCAFLAFALLVRASLGSDLDALKKNRETAVGLLHKITQGQNPCYSSSCQNRKTELIHRLFDLSDLLPDAGFLFLKSRLLGLHSAHLLIRNPFPSPLANEYCPRTLSDWKMWWMKRYSFEAQAKSQWMTLYSEAYSLGEALQIYRQLSKSGGDRKQLIQELWHRGAGTAARAMMESRQFIRESDQWAQENNREKSQALREQALKASEELKAIDASRFNGEFKLVLQNTFSPLNFVQAISFLDVVNRFARFSGARDIFETNFEEEMLSRADDLRELIQVVQEFQDIEYGVVGIENFESTVNPEIAAKKELPIQIKLDGIDLQARRLVDLGAFYFLSLTGRSLLGPSPLSRATLPTLAELFSIQMDLNPTEKWWPMSHRTQELENQVPALEEEMTKRKRALLDAQRVLEVKIRSLDRQISLMEDSHEKRPDL